MRQVRVVRSGMLVATALAMLVTPALAQDGRTAASTRSRGSVARRGSVNRCGRSTISTRW